MDLVRPTIHRYLLAVFDVAIGELGSLFLRASAVVVSIALASRTAVPVNGCGNFVTPFVLRASRLLVRH
jgi:hypothetical protein